jgi:hypothetical protein
MFFWIFKVLEFLILKIRNVFWVRLKGYLYMRPISYRIGDQGESNKGHQVDGALVGAG